MPPQCALNFDSLRPESIEKTRLWVSRNHITLYWILLFGIGDLAGYNLGHARQETGCHEFVYYGAQTDHRGHCALLTEYKRTGECQI